MCNITVTRPYTDPDLANAVIILHTSCLESIENDDDDAGEASADQTLHI